MWNTDPTLAAWLVLLALAGGCLPVGVAWVGKLVIDAVIASLPGGPGGRDDVLFLLGVELGLVAALLGAYRGTAFCESLLRVRLAQGVTESVVGRALQLELEELEDPEVHDVLSRTLAEAPTRPLSLVRGVLASSAESITLVGYGCLLARFSPILVGLLLLAAGPAIVAELRFNADAFRLFKRQTPENRRREYLETVLTREDFAKEVRVFSTGRALLGEHRALFDRLYAEDRSLALRRTVWGGILAVAGATALAVSYALVAWSALGAEITIGEMAMLFAVLKQSQGLVASLLISVAALYEDHLYVAMLFGFLDRAPRPWPGSATAPLGEGDGLRLEDVSYTYPGAAEPAVRAVTLHVPAGTLVALAGANGAGKSTLVKLALGLLRPSSGRVLVDGRDVLEWSREALSRRLSAVFQDFVRYQLTCGQNVGMGDGDAVNSRSAWERAVARAGVSRVVDGLEGGFDAQLGHWFPGGRDLSLGQWQRLALARSFARDGVTVRVLDEPTAHLDADGERDVVERLRRQSDGVATLVVSHRWSVVSACDRVVLLGDGRIVADGSPREVHGLWLRSAGAAPADVPT